jgi:hypothetical protein
MSILIRIGPICNDTSTVPKAFSTLLDDVLKVYTVRRFHVWQQVQLLTTPNRLTLKDVPESAKISVADIRLIMGDVGRTSEGPRGALKKKSGRALLKDLMEEVPAEECTPDIRKGRDINHSVPPARAPLNNSMANEPFTGRSVPSLLATGAQNSELESELSLFSCNT